jgi:hypothetical protein
MYLKGGSFVYRCWLSDIRVALLPAEGLVRLSLLAFRYPLEGFPGQPAILVNWPLEIIIL